MIKQVSVIIVNILSGFQSIGWSSFCLKMVPRVSRNFANAFSSLLHESSVRIPTKSRNVLLPVKRNTTSLNFHYLFYFLIIVYEPFLIRNSLLLDLMYSCDEV